MVWLDKWYDGPEEKEKYQILEGNIKFQFGKVDFEMSFGGYVHCAVECKG